MICEIRFNKSIRKEKMSMRKLQKRFLSRPNTVEAYACVSANCTCNPAYCAATWESMVQPLYARNSDTQLHIKKVTS